MAPIFIVLSAIILLIGMVATDEISLGRYRRGLRVPDDRPDWMSSRKYRDIHLYQEPLYANADPSLPIHRPKKIAIIGGYSDTSGRLRHSTRRVLLDANILFKEAGLLESLRRTSLEMIEITIHYK
jgi:hypothetical protein